MGYVQGPECTQTRTFNTSQISDWYFNELLLYLTLVLFILDSNQVAMFGLCDHAQHENHLILLKGRVRAKRKTIWTDAETRICICLAKDFASCTQE